MLVNERIPRRFYSVDRERIAKLQNTSFERCTTRHIAVFFARPNELHRATPKNDLNDEFAREFEKNHTKTFCCFVAVLSPFSHFSLFCFSQSQIICTSEKPRARDALENRKLLKSDFRKRKIIFKSGKKILRKNVKV